jgi:putative ABC transport system substrate-binding protein
MTSRRESLAYVAYLAALVPSLAISQSSHAIRRVGFLEGSSRDASPWTISALVQGMRDLGFVEGRNVVWEMRFANGKYERLADLASELVGLKVDVLVTAGTPATRAAKLATTEIPVVMVGVGDPIGNGFVTNLARPDRNITGVSNIGADSTPKRIELLVTVAPKARRIGYLYNPDNPVFSSGLQLAEKVASFEKKIPNCSPPC